MDEKMKRREKRKEKKSESDSKFFARQMASECKMVISLANGE